MNKVVLFMSVVEFCHGFLLDNSNTSSVVKQTYLTVSEYYGDKNQLHSEIEAYHTEQENFRKQQEAYRNQQDRALQLLADQLKQRLLSMEQKISEKNASQQQPVNLLEQRYQELEKKYTDMKEYWEQKYKELEQNYTELDQTLRNQIRTCLDVNAQLQNKINFLEASADHMENKTNEILHDLDQISHLKALNQLQTLSKLEEKVQTFDSRITLLSGHEQSWNQDLIAISKKLKEMEVQHNISIVSLQQKEEQNKDNFIKKLEMLTNTTSGKMELLSQTQNQSITHLQQTVEQDNKKVVLMGCNHQTSVHFKSGSTFKFPVVVTKVGLPLLTTFSSTGKFICSVKGIYYISAVITSYDQQVVIDFMKNSVSMHRQFITSGSTGGYWEPGTAIVALELNVNDTIWIKTNTDAHIYHSCFTIFKI